MVRLDARLPHVSAAVGEAGAVIAVERSASRAQLNAKQRLRRT